MTRKDKDNILINNIKDLQREMVLMQLVVQRIHEDSDSLCTFSELMDDIGDNEYAEILSKQK